MSQNELLLRTLWRGEKQTLGLLEKECDLCDPQVRRVRNQKAAIVAELEKKLNHEKSSQDQIAIAS